MIRPEQEAFSFKSNIIFVLKRKTGNPEITTLKQQDIALYHVARNINNTPIDLFV